MKDEREFKVVIRQNNQNQTYTGTLKAELSHVQAVDIGSQLNACFSEHGIRWFAQIEEVEP